MQTIELIEQASKNLFKSSKVWQMNHDLGGKGFGCFKAISWPTYSQENKN